MKIAIVGGGLAGTACAYFLNQYGADCILFDSAGDVATGASGNAYGMYNPRLSALLTPEAIFYRDAFELALDLFPKLDDIDLHMCGNLNLVTDAQKEKRFNKMLDHWGWSVDMARMVNADEASDLAGVKLNHAALFMPRAGMVSPPKLCRALVRGVEVRHGAAIHDTADFAAFDAVILACGAGALQFAELDYLPLKAVRGQITQVQASNHTAALKTALGYGGYFTPAVEGVHMLGATFDRDAMHNDVFDADDAQNIEGLGEAVPHLVKNLKVAGRRAAVRVTSRDYFPVVGRIPAHLSKHDNVYVSIAHGSHGIITSLKAGEFLAQTIMQKPLSLPDVVLARLSPARYN